MVSHVFHLYLTQSSFPQIANTIKKKKKALIT